LNTDFDVQYVLLRSIEREYEAVVTSKDTLPTFLVHVTKSSTNEVSLFNLLLISVKIDKAFELYKAKQTVDLTTEVAEVNCTFTFLLKFT
jgi:hypothetical protein